jgi:hypothetical protein
MPFMALGRRRRRKVKHGYQCNDGGRPEGSRVVLERWQRPPCGVSRKKKKDDHHHRFPREMREKGRV